jgi:hypothetical protein
MPEIGRNESPKRPRPEFPKGEVRKKKKRFDCPAVGCGGKVLEDKGEYICSNPLHYMHIYKHS